MIAMLTKPITLYFQTNGMNTISPHGINAQGCFLILLLWELFSVSHYFTTVRW
jgi:hypothetical protein